MSTETMGQTIPWNPWYPIASLYRIEVIIRIKLVGRDPIGFVDSMESMGTIESMGSIVSKGFIDFPRFSLPGGLCSGMLGIGVTDSAVRKDQI